MTTEDYDAAMPALREYAGKFEAAIAEVRAEYARGQYETVHRELLARLRAVGIEPVPQVVEDLARQICAGER
ncbi:hypothetical protein [Streptacidiphilus cavernicola]|uniref:Uncharacterized protein n=1 Tax=Streptacidiphilus cavernicola TaxID=3342716 RepID=A0ABV6VUK5_9ACTN